MFLRQTKKAYISFITLDHLQPIVDLGHKTPTWNDIRLACYYKGLKMDMRFCRKIYASHLSAYGIQSEVIDFLQGRVSASVFSRHYLTPSKDLKEKVLQAVNQLQKVIEH